MLNLRNILIFTWFFYGSTSWAAEPPVRMDWHEQGSFQAHIKQGSKPTKASFSTRTPKVAVGTNTGEAFIWNYEDNTIIRILPEAEPPTPVTHIALSMDGTSCLIGRSTSAIVWNENSPFTELVTDTLKPVKKVELSNDAQTGMIARGNRGIDHIEIWKRFQGAYEKVYHYGPRRNMTAALSPDGSIFMYSNSQGRSLLRNAMDGTIQHHFYKQVQSYMFDPVNFEWNNEETQFSHDGKNLLVLPGIGFPFLSQIENNYQQSILNLGFLSKNFHATFTHNGLYLAHYSAPELTLLRVSNKRKTNQVTLHLGEDTSLLEMAYGIGDRQLLFLTNTGQLFGLDSPTPPQEEQYIVFPELKDVHAPQMSLQLRARASSGLPVEFELVDGPAILKENTLLLTGEMGKVTILAKQSGNALWLPAKPITQTFQVTTKPIIPTRILFHPQDQLVMEGNSVSFFVGVEGSSPFKIQWFKNGIPIEDANHEKFSIEETSSLDIGSYRVVVTSDEGIMHSRLAQLRLEPESALIPWVKYLPAPLTSASFTPNGKWLAAFSEQGVDLYDPVSGQKLAHFHRGLYETILQEREENTPYRQQINLIWDGHAPMATKRRIASPNELYQLDIMDNYEGAKLYRLPENSFINFLEAPGTDAADTGALFSPDGNSVLVSYHDNWGTDQKRGVVHLWDVTDGSILESFNESKDKHTGYIRSMGFSPDSSKIVTVGMEGTAKVFYEEDNQRKVTTVGRHKIPTSHLKHCGGVSEWAFYITKEWLLQFSEICGNTLFAHPLTEDATNEDIISIPVDSPTVIGFSNFHFGGGFKPKSARKIYRLIDSRRKLVMRLPASEHYSSLSAVNADGTIAAITDQAEGQKQILICSLTQNEVIRMQDWPQENGFVKLISKDGSTLISLNSNGKVMVWNDALALTLHTPKGDNKTLTLSPDEKTLFIGTRWSLTPTDQSQLWDLSDGTLKSTLKGHRSFIKNASFSPDTKKIVTIEDDNTLNLWRTSDGMLLQELKNQDIPFGDIFSAYFTEGGHQLTVTDSNFTQYTWDIENLPPLPKPHIAWNGSGKIQVTNTLPGSYVHLIWSADVEDWSNAALLETATPDQTSSVLFNADISERAESGFYRVEVSREREIP